MPFITQGKTNLKYILIVIVLAVIVGGGILGYYYSWIKELDIRLSELELKLPEVKQPEVKTPEVTAELLTSCIADTDCERYIVYNQCKVYCANKDEANLQIIKKLEETKLCDPALWFAPPLNCGCVNNQCVVKQEEKTEDETANWKTYQNLNGGFQINYPSEMIVKVEELEQDLLPLGEFNETISFLFPDDIKTGVAGVGIESAVNIEDPRMTWPTLQVIDPKIQAEFIQTFLYPDCCNEAREIFFGGKVGYKLEFKSDQTHPYYKIFIIFIFGKDQKSLLAIAGTARNEQQSQVVDKILSTFKFLE